MKCMIPEISWHNREPVLSIDIQQIENDGFYRLATGGADYHVLIWHGTLDEKGAVHIEVVSDLTRHQKAVNSVRWSPNGTFLASADDDANIILWTLKTDNIPLLEPSNSNDKEIWIIHKILRGHKEDIYDLAWSPNSLKLLSGSIDNSAILWDINKGHYEHIISDHKGFVQGVCWDPKGQYIATLSSDRFCRIFDANTKQVRSRIHKGILPVPKDHGLCDKEVKYFHDDTFKSYFRRLTFTPDGSMIIAPAGCVETDEIKKDLRGTYLFTLDSIPRPVGIFPLEKQCSVAVRCSPILYELKENGPKPYVELPYRMVIAVATESDVFVYDTQQQIPFAHLKNVHYTRLTDLTWSADGMILVASSTDGFCTLLSFRRDEIGVPYVKEESEDEKENNTLNISGIEELPQDELSSAQPPVKETPKRTSFLLSWANKAKEDAKAIKEIAEINVKGEKTEEKSESKEEKKKINVLVPRKVSKDNLINKSTLNELQMETNKKNLTKQNEKSLENCERSRGEESSEEKTAQSVDARKPTIIYETSKIIKISDSPEKQNLAPKQSESSSKTRKVTPIAIRRKPTASPKATPKPNPLLNFLNRSAEKKPILVDDEARDAWRSEETHKNEQKMDVAVGDDDDDTLVPDLNLRIDEDTKTQSTNDAERETNNDVVIIDSPAKEEKKNSPPKRTSTSGTQTNPLPILEAMDRPRVPRRVPLITLSSPKVKKIRRDVERNE